MTVTWPQAIGSLGLAVSIIGSSLLYKGTWASEPEPALDIEDLVEGTRHYADMENIRQRRFGADARSFRERKIDEALYGARRRNVKRLNLNRIGFFLLMVGFVLQLIALWLK